MNELSTKQRAAAIRAGTHNGLKTRWIPVAELRPGHLMPWLSTMLMRVISVRPYTGTLDFACIAETDKGGISIEHGDVEIIDDGEVRS